LRLVESYAVGMPDDTISWVFAVKNNGDEPLWVGVRAVCADDSGRTAAERDDIERVCSFKKHTSDSNTIIKKIIVIKEDDDDNRRSGGGGGGTNVDIDVHIKNAVSAKTNINNIVNNVNINNGSGTQIVNTFTNIANSKDIDQKNKLTQFLINTPQSGDPEFRDTVAKLTDASRNPDAPIDFGALPVSKEPIVVDHQHHQEHQEEQTHQQQQLTGQRNNKDKDKQTIKDV
jgi:hypothetical protein